MKILFLSNGHGEDGIAVQIAQAVQQFSHIEKVVALPMVGQGHAYRHQAIPIVGPVKSMPSGGFIYMDGGRQLARDIKGGLLKLTWQQFQTLRAWVREGGKVLAVGDIVPLLMAWLSGATYAFVGTAKSDYYLQDEAGPLPGLAFGDRLATRLGGVYLPWERWLMGRPGCRAIFPRDSLTASLLLRYGLPVFDLGNPMMDGLAATLDALPVPNLSLEPGDRDPLVTLLLPGSRLPEAYANWQRILQGVESLIGVMQSRPLWFLGAIAPGLDLLKLDRALQDQGWVKARVDSTESDFDDRPCYQKFSSQGYSVHLMLTSQNFAACAQRADLAIAMTGTATEQFVGLGKPAITFAGEGPQFTPAFARAQTRLLGPSIRLVDGPEETGHAVAQLLADPDILQTIGENGKRRMGSPGAARRIAECLVAQFSNLG